MDRFHPPAIVPTHIVFLSDYDICWRALGQGVEYGSTRHGDLGASEQAYEVLVNEVSSLKLDCGGRKHMRLR